MTMSRPLPSDIDIGIDRPTPFPGCFRRVEAEVCAALIVASCRERGDTWQPCRPQDVFAAADAIAETSIAASAGGGIARSRVPTWFILLGQIDIHTLVELGAVTKSDDVVEVTDLFLERLRERGFVRGAGAPPKYSTRKCDSCPADIVWCQSATTKRPMPLDAAPSPNGNTCIVAGEGGVGRIAHVLAGDDLEEARARGAKLHVSHFATCPNAKKHRKPSKALGDGPGKR